jgi:hypothetical protein
MRWPIAFNTTHKLSANRRRLQIAAPIWPPSGLSQEAGNGVVVCPPGGGLRDGHLLQVGLHAAKSTPVTIAAGLISTRSVISV